MQDITTKQDIEILVNTFYGKVLKDESLAPFFKQLDFDIHMPKMIHFWSFVLFSSFSFMEIIMPRLQKRFLLFLLTRESS